MPALQPYTEIDTQNIFKCTQNISNPWNISFESEEYTRCPDVDKFLGEVKSNKSSAGQNKIGQFFHDNLMFIYYLRSLPSICLINSTSNTKYNLTAGRMNNAFCLGHCKVLNHDNNEFCFVVLMAAWPPGKSVTLKIAVVFV